MSMMDWLAVNLTENPLFVKGLAAGLATLFIYLAVHFAKAATSRRIEDKDLRYKMRKAFGLAGYALTLITIVSIFSDQMTNLTVIIGALGLGVGFALRELIQSLIGWGIISFGGQYKIGERIQIGGVMGDVIDIGPLTTTVMECGGWVAADLYNGRLVRLSNSMVFKEHIVNYTSDFPFLWDEIVIPVRIDSDHRLARSLIEKVANAELSKINQASKDVWGNFVRQYRIEDARLDPVITLSFDSNWIEITLRYVVDYRARRSTKDKLFSGVLEEFEASHGRVKIASASMQITGITPLPLPHQEDRRQAS